MNKRLTITVSILLILAGILIHFLIENSNSNLNEELVQFFAGLLFGMGIMLPVGFFLRKRRGK